MLWARDDDDDVDATFLDALKSIVGWPRAGTDEFDVDAADAGADAVAEGVGPGAGRPVVMVRSRDSTVSQRDAIDLRPK